ncbi:T9SS type A sorting domain-containing protein [Flaviramulus sp. BrNp1-15]|uniref:T9SS type A sorting domain-containing protein n=1 Tax=Flaviramulus sp. BrNp1-15 TaxID=2916754 RepID=UPI001EE80F4A|nr:T9SS type A sorting domain-containing protein [Flaviramulus sp. BrNp1-15]ULC58870.1 T9SS type A sorting domain-containing protein [Flaviramulus sp. BrNp1-15]
MKKLTIIAILVFCGFANAQITCPTDIKTSGQSTPPSPIFTVPNGQNGCNESWPTSITVNGSLTYNYVSCSGGNLKYEIETGQTPPADYEMTIDFGGGVVCSYNSTGGANTLSLKNEELKLDFKIAPNPTSGVLNVELDHLNEINSLDVYSVSGRKVYTVKENNEINISHLSSGVYILRADTKKGVLNTKIIKK